MAVSYDGSTILVGEPDNGGDTGDDDEMGDEGGVVHEFTPSGGGWSQRKLYPSGDGDAFMFGREVALSGDGRTVVITAPFDETSNGKKSGRAWVSEL